MERYRLEAEVIAHVQREHLNHVHQREEGTQKRGARDHEKDGGHDLGDTAEELVEGRGTHEHPEERRERHRADRLHQRRERRRHELNRDDLRHPVIEHLRGQRESNEEKEPLVKGDVLDASSVDP